MSEAHVQSLSNASPGLPWLGDLLADHKIWSLHQRQTPCQISTFRIPGFRDQNVFMILKAFDQQDGGALHYGTAHIACAIVAGNAWDGYFTSTRDGERVNVGQDGLLRGHSYYFHVPSFSASSSIPAQPPTDFPRYPLCLSFEHWSFPHGNLPPA